MASTHRQKNKNKKYLLKTTGSKNLQHDKTQQEPNAHASKWHRCKFHGI